MPPPPPTHLPLLTAPRLLNRLPADLGAKLSLALTGLRCLPILSWRLAGIKKLAELTASVAANKKSPSESVALRRCRQEPKQRQQQRATA